MRFARELSLHPTTHSPIIRLAPALLELFPDGEENAGRRPLPPLPLAEVQANLAALHAKCNGTHICGIPEELQRFDLYRDYLVPMRAYRQRHGRNGHGA